MKIPKLPSGVSIFRDSSGDRHYWVLRLGKRWTAGQVIRRTFSTASAAKSAWEEETSKRTAFGTGGYQLSSSQLGEAIACFQLLDGTQLTLSEAVKLAIKATRPKKASISLQDAIKAFLEAQKAKGAAPRTLLNYQSFLRLFAANLPTNMLIHRISPTDITKHLSRYERPASRNGHLHHLQAFFRWTVKRGWRDDDPTIHIGRARIVDEPITILSVEQCARLLEVCQSDSKCTPLLPAIAVGLFAGLRASEIAALDWSEIQLDASPAFIEVPARKSKTRRRRIVSIADCLHQWLQPFARLNGPITPDHWRKRHGHMQQLVKLMPWPRNCLRHSFGSYHFALHRNESLTAAEMGNTPTIVFAHYREVVKPTDAKRFWNLAPCRAINVVEFAV